MMDILNKRQSGNLFETKALKYLEAQGLALVEKNYQNKLGEIDLIMRDGKELVFVEVRTRSQDDYGTAVESVGEIKQGRIIRAAIIYLQNLDLLDKIDCRFDIIGISGTKSNMTFEWLKDAFSTDFF